MPPACGIGWVVGRLDVPGPQQVCQKVWHRSRSGQGGSSAELRAPQNVKELRQQLGLINHLCKFVPGLQGVLKPLHDLLRRGVAWVWTPIQQQAHEAAKKMIQEAPVLAFYDSRKKTVSDSGEGYRGAAPAEMLMGRSLRTRLPRAPEPDHEEWREARKRGKIAKGKGKRKFDRHYGARHL